MDMNHYNIFQEDADHLITLADWIDVQQKDGIFKNTTETEIQDDLRRIAGFINNFLIMNIH